MVQGSNRSKDARNVTFKKRIGLTPYQAMYGEKKEGHLRLPSIRMQSLDFPRQSTPRERKAHFKGKGSWLCWICTKHEHVGILGPGGQETYDNESSKV